jgi:Flp pilus assembly protein TadG
MLSPSSRGPFRRRRERGAVALEYALVLPFFLAAVFALFSIGFTFVVQGLLDNATQHAARLMRIGNYSGSADEYGTQLVTKVCDDLSIGGHSVVPSCQTNIQVYVAATDAGVPSGSGFASLSPAKINGNVMTQRQDYVSSKYDVILQIGYAYPWALMDATGKTLLVSTLAFQTEPY